VATSISVANFETALGECYDAVAAENVANAKKWLRLAKIQFDGLSASLAGDGFSKTRRASLDGAAAAVADLIQSSADGGLFEVHSRWVL
jgi:hypothetical protein